MALNKAAANLRGNAMALASESPFLYIQASAPRAFNVNETCKLPRAHSRLTLCGGKRKDRFFFDIKRVFYPIASKLGEVIYASGQEKNQKSIKHKGFGRASPLRKLIGWKEWLWKMIKNSKKL